MSNLDKIRQEIERRRLHFNKEAEKYQALNNGYSQNCYGARDALRDLVNFLDTLSEEPDKSLEEAARLWVAGVFLAYTAPEAIVKQLREIAEKSFKAGAEWQKEQDNIIGKAISYFGAESLLDNANGLTDFEKFTAWLYCEFLRGLPKKLNQDYIKEQSKVILGAIKKELGKMPDSTELIAQWDAEREMLEQKDFRGDEWRLAQNAYFDGFGSGYLVQEQQMLKEAVEGVVYRYESYQRIATAIIVDIPREELGNKVKIIIVKED